MRFQPRWLAARRKRGRGWSCCPAFVGDCWARRRAVRVASRDKGVGSPCTHTCVRCGISEGLFALHPHLTRFEVAPPIGLVWRLFSLSADAPTTTLHCAPSRDADPCTRLLLFFVLPPVLPAGLSAAARRCRSCERPRRPRRPTARDSRTPTRRGHASRATAAAAAPGAERRQQPSAKSVPLLVLVLPPPPPRQPVGAPGTPLSDGSAATASGGGKEDGGGPAVAGFEK